MYVYICRRQFPPSDLLAQATADRRTHHTHTLNNRSDDTRDTHTLNTDTHTLNNLCVMTNKIHTQ